VGEAPLSPSVGVFFLCIGVKINIYLKHFYFLQNFG
jgi:hypothetical protein